MFSIRTRMFETNSSSVHSFIVPKESKLLKIPKLVKIFGPADPTTPEGRIRLMYDLANDFGFADYFKLYLKSKGITIDDDYEPEVDKSSLLSCIGLTEAEFEQVLFNPEAVSRDDKNFDKLYESGDYDYISIRG